MNLRVDSPREDIGLSKIVTFARLRGCSVADPCNAAIAYSDIAIVDDALGRDDAAANDEIEITHWHTRFCTQ